MNTSKDILELPLSGVESEHCSLIVDKGLAKVPGITSHKVELNNHKAIVTATDNDAILQAVTAIRDLGYDVETIKQNFPVTGMTCASCASSAESIVVAQPGVVKAAVNFANTSLQVEYIPTITSPQKLKTAVQGIGYDLQIVDSKEAKAALEDLYNQKLKALKQRTILAVALSIPLVAIGMFFMTIPYANYAMWALATPVVLVLGRQFFINAYKQAKHRLLSPVLFVFPFRVRRYSQ